MSARFTAHTQRLKWAGINASGASGLKLHTNTEADAGDFTICIWWYCEEPENDNTERAIKEINNNSTSCHTITVQATAGVYTFRWYVANTLVSSVVVNETCLNKTVNLFASFRKDATYANSDTQMFAHVRGGSVYSGTLATGITSVSVLAPNTWVLGSEVKLGTSATALGVPIIFVTNNVIRDGTNGSANYADIIAYDSPVGVALKDYTKIILGANHVGAAHLRSANTPDSRLGKAVANNNIAAIDKSNASLPNYYYRDGINTLTIGGAAPVHVDPHTYSGQALYPAIHNPNPTTIAPASAVKLAAPFGAPGPVLRNLVELWKGNTPSRVIRMFISANSRNGYYTFCDIMDRNGTFRGVNAHTGYNESGVYSQTNFWSNLIGHINATPPTGYAGITPPTNEDAGTGGADDTQAEEPVFGFRCNGTVGYPVVKDNSDAASTIVTGTYRTLDTPVSRFWCSSRPASISSYTSDHYIGPGSPRGIFAGYSYRIMCSPEHTMPTTEPLQIQVVIINVPSSSTIQYVKKQATVSTQNGADTLGAADEAGMPALGSAMTALTIASTSGSFTYNGTGDVTARQSVVVDDTGNGMSPYGVGDIIELLNSSGVPKSTGTPSQSRPEISVIYAISGKGTGTCTITLERPFRSTITAASDKIKCIDARNLYKVITLTFAAGEVASGYWRGVKIKASNDSKSGIIIASITCLNTFRRGIATGNWGWPGVGYGYQTNRLSSVAHAVDGKTCVKRMMEILNPDIVFISQGNQGIASGEWVTRYSSFRDLWRNNTSCEIVWAQGGPEMANQAGGDWSPATAPSESHCVMQHIAAANNEVMVSWMFSTRGCHQLVRGTTCDDLNNDEVHPTAAVELDIWMSQSSNLLDASESSEASTSAFNGASRFGARFGG